MEEVINVEGIEEFRESEVRIKGNVVELTREDYDKLHEDLEIAQLQLQEANDTLNGGITARNMANFRNTYVVNVSDSLDDTYPMYVRFSVLDETVNIVSVKVSYWIDNFRAYAKSTVNAEEDTSGASGSASGGGDTSGIAGGSTYTAHEVQYSVGSPENRKTYPAFIGDVTGIPTGYYAEDVATTNKDVKRVQHKHYMGNHAHTTPDHTHPNHTHTIPAHNHDITYGIFEDDTAPTIKFSVSQDGGVGYSREYGNTPVDQELLDITDSITKTGSKILKFESTTRARLTVQVEIKVDISVR